MTRKYEFTLKTGMQAGQPTAAGHIYTREALEKLADEINAKSADGQPVLGSLGQSEDGRIRLRDVTHQVRSAKVVNGQLEATIEFVEPTPENAALMAKLKRALTGEPALFSLGARGVGSVDASGKVGADFKLTSLDVVPNPPGTRQPSIVDKIATLDESMMPEEELLRLALRLLRETRAGAQPWDQVDRLLEAATERKLL